MWPSGLSVRTNPRFIALPEFTHNPPRIQFPWHQHTYRLDNFSIAAPRSAGGDSLFVTISLAVAGNPAVTALQFVGLRNQLNQTFPLGISQGIWAADTEMIPHIYTMISSGHLSEAQAEAEIRNTVGYLANVWSQAVAQNVWYDGVTNTYPATDALMATLGLSFPIASAQDYDNALGQWLTNNIAGLQGCDGAVAVRFWAVPANDLHNLSNDGHGGLLLNHQLPRPTGCLPNGRSDYSVHSSAQ